MTELKTMNRDDNVFATLVAKGKTLKSFCGKNFNNLGELVRMMCVNCDGYRGLAQLNIRNQSQGWSLNLLLMIDNRNSKVGMTQTIEPPRDGLQYRFPW